MPAPQRPALRLRQHLLRAIAAGRLRPGAPCPTDRRLAADLGMARATAQQALQQLQRDGVVERHGRQRRIARPDAVGHTGGAGSLWPATVAIIAPGTNALMPDEAARGWWQHLQFGAQAALHAAGLHILLLHRERLRQGDLDRLLRPPPHGLLLLEPGMIRELSAQVLRAIAGRQLPMVCVGDEDGMAGFDRVASDHAAGAGLLVARLVAAGRRRIVPLAGGGVQPAWARERQRGYLAAMAAAGLPAHQPITLPFGDGPGTTTATERLLARLAGRLEPRLREAHAPDALLAPSDGQALLVNAALRRLGLVPGEQVCVTGYDAYWWQAPIRAWCPDPPWATVDKGNQQLGLACVQLLQERIAGSLPSGPQRRLLPPAAVLGSSIGLGQYPGA